MGDVAGIGPEIIAKSWPELVTFCHPTVIGDPAWLQRSVQALRLPHRVIGVADPARVALANGTIAVLSGSAQSLDAVVPGQVSDAAGRAAYDFLCTALDLVVAQQADGIVTAPLNKEGLHAAGLRYPGHTEILAERTGTRDFGMMLYARGSRLPHGVGVVHVTLHMALRDVFRNLTVSAVLEKIRLLHGIMNRLSDRQPPRLAVAALNPHASDGGLFGDEERTVIKPAVREAVREGICVSGPRPSDTLFVQAARGDYDGIVAMYHDQGHIPLKLLSGLAAVNITLGLPIIRTSVAHGTGYDIAGKGIADPSSLVEAARVAARLVAWRPNMMRAD